MLFKKSKQILDCSNVSTYLSRGNECSTLRRLMHMTFLFIYHVLFKARHIGKYYPTNDEFQTCLT